MRKLLLALFFASLPAWAQVSTGPPILGFTSTIANLPATCRVGQIWFATNASAGSNIYGCTSTNTWTAQAGGGGGGTPGGSSGDVQYNNSGSFGGITPAAGRVLAGSPAAFTATPTLGASGTLGSIAMGNATSGTVTLRPVTGALGSVTVSLPAATDTLVGKATTDTFTNKTYDTAGTGNAFAINGTAITAVTGTGAVMLTASPTTTGTLTAAAANFSGNITAANLTPGGTLTNGNFCRYNSTGPVIDCAVAPAAGQVLNNAAFTATPTLGASGTVGTLALGNATSGTVTLGTVTGALGSVTVSLPAATDTLVGKATTDTLTNKTLTTPTISSPVITGSAITFTTGTSRTLANAAEIIVCTSTCTVTPPGTLTAGMQFCVQNDDNVSTVITLAAVTAVQYEATARTSYGTANHTMTSAGAVKDQICMVAVSTTKLNVFSSVGTWTNN